MKIFQLLRVFGLIFVILFACVCISSCSSNEEDEEVAFSIVGTWQTQYDDGETEIWSFSPNGKYVATSSNNPDGYDGDYEYSNGTLTYTDRSYSVVNGKKEYDGYFSTYVAKVKVLSNDSFILTIKSYSLTFTRVH